MAELKLRRLTELNQRLQEDLNRRRIAVSEASMEYVVIVTYLVGLMEANVMDSLIAFTDKEPKDFMVPSRWGTVSKRHSSYNIHGTGLRCCLDRPPRGSLRPSTIEPVLLRNVRRACVLHTRHADDSFHPSVCS